MQDRRRTLLIALPVALLVLVAVFPFLWMAGSAFKPLAQLYTIPPRWLPDPPPRINFKTVLFESNIPRYFVTSLIISIGSTSLAMFFAIFAAYLSIGHAS